LRIILPQPLTSLVLQQLHIQHPLIGPLQTRFTVLVEAVAVRVAVHIILVEAVAVAVGFLF
jgi:hypothetical protein